MNKKAACALGCIVPLIAIIASQTADISDFLSGFILGLAIVVELVAIVFAAKEIKAGKKDK